MEENQSPWITHLKRHRPVHVLSGHIDTDILVIGGGIAGASTLYYLLKKTDKRVVLIDAYKVGHGATGHNAGMACGGFEDSTDVRIARFGLEKSLDAERIIDRAWQLLDEIYVDTNITTHRDFFTSYGGYADLDIIISDIKSYCYYYDLAGVPFELFLISKESGVYEKIPNEYKKYCIIVPQSEIEKLLETKDNRYIAALPLRMACFNSAQWSEDVISYCLKTTRKDALCTRIPRWSRL